MTELHELTALEQGELVRRGEVSPVELVEHYARRSDDVGAFVTRTTEQALGRARGLGEPGSRRCGACPRRSRI